MKCNFPSGPRNLYISPVYHDLVRALCSFTEDKIASSAMRVPALKDAMQKDLCKTINKEIQDYCKTDQPAILRTKGKGKDDLDTFSLEALEQQLTVKTPLFRSVLKGACTNPRLVRNKHKNEVSNMAPMLSAGATLINTYSRDMCVVKEIKSIILKKGGLKKSAFKRLGKLYDCMSYNYVNDLLDVFSSRYYVTILKWKAQVESPECCHAGYSLGNDNVDWELGRRHMTLEKQRKSIHKINVIAYKNRVSSID